MPTENDHDLLIQIATKLDRAILDIKDLKDDTTRRVSTLEEEKVSQKDFDDLKNDVDPMLKWWLKTTGALLIIQFIIGYLLISHYGNTPL